MNYSAVNQTSTNPDTSFIANNSNSNSNIMSNKSQLPPPPPLVSQVSISTICIANDSNKQQDNDMANVDPKNISPPFIATRTRSQEDTARRQLKLKRRDSIEHDQPSTRRSQRRRVTVDSSTDSDAILNLASSTSRSKTEQQYLKQRPIHTSSTSSSSNETVSDDTSIVDLVSSFSSSSSISVKDELAATNLAYLDELASELDFVWDQNEITMLQYDPTKTKKN